MRSGPANSGAGCGSEPGTDDLDPRWTSENRPCVDISKPANGAEPEQEYSSFARGHSAKHFLAYPRGGIHTDPTCGGYGNAGMRLRRLSGGNGWVVQSRPFATFWHKSD